MAEASLAPLFTWRSAVASQESGLAPTQRLVALTLSLHMNEKGGSAFPGARLLADETGLAVGTVRRVLGELVSEGWLHLEERGGLRGQSRRANHYLATIPHPALPVTDDDPSRRMTRHPVMHDPSSSDAPPLTEDDPRSSCSSSLNSSSSAAGASEGLAAAISTACRQEHIPPPKTRARDQLDKASADIALHGATPHDVPQRAREYRRRWPNVALTPLALAKHWPQLAPQESRRPEASAYDPTPALIAAGLQEPS